MPTTSVPTTSPEDYRQARLAALTAALILLAAAAVRYLAGCDGLWLDEIWTLILAQEVRSPGQILTGLHQENNHYLNTLCVWWLGPQSNWIVYRLPAMLAGAASVGVAGLIGRRRSRSAALLAMLLTGSSYLMIHYSSEARGYSFAICFALMALDFQENLFRRPGLPVAFCTAGCSIAGILSQPVYLAFYAALVVWSAWKAWFPPKGLGRIRGLWWLSHLPPLLFFVWLYEVDLWQVVNAGGPVYSAGDVVAQTASLAIGGPDGPGQFAAATLCAVAFALSLWRLWRSDRDWCVLAVLAIVVMPALLLIATGRREIYPRYFVIPVALLGLTIAFALASVWQNGSRPARSAVIVLCGAFVVANGIHVTRLVTYGRGGYMQAVEYLAEHTPGDEITVGSDFDFRNEMVLAFYRNYLPEPKQLTYLKTEQRRKRNSEWLLIHSLDRRFEPASEVHAGRTRYVLRQFYPYAGLSGWGWGLYHRDE
ncbi:MAG: hypothetical protein EXS05_11210 [Planctomycetaceae bacterium]|nr:hypothetical protein [Planctomycetaceae bacterium]